MRKYVSLLIALFLVIGITVLESCGQNGDNSTRAKENALNLQANVSEQRVLIPVPRDGKWGVIDEVGNWIVKPQFENVYSYSEGLAVVKVGDVYGCIDKAGKLIVSPRFALITPFKDGLAIAYEYHQQRRSNSLSKGNAGFIDRSGNWVIEPRFKVLSRFNEGLASAWADDGDGYIDKEGSWAIRKPGIFCFAKEFSEGLASAGNSSNRDFLAYREGFIDKTGDWAIKPIFEFARGFRNGLASVRYEGKWGFIDRAGTWVIPPQFDDVKPGYFEQSLEGSISSGKEGLAPVCVGGKDEGYISKTRSKWGYIDKSGRWIINPQYEDAEPFSGAFAAVMVGGRPDELGITINGKWGVIDREGSWIVPPLLDSQPVFFSGHIRGVFNQNYIVLNSYGVIVWKEDTSGSNDSLENVMNSVGSGFYVSAEGHVLTNSHVIHNAKKIIVSGQNAHLVDEDLANDIALLIVEPKPGNFVTFNKSNRTIVGEGICTYGFPLAGLLSSKGCLSVGSISSMSGIGNNASEFQISAPIQPGNSGGPVLNNKGHVIGIIVSGLSDTAISKLTGQVPQNVNFAINAATLRAFLDANNVPYRISSLFSIKKSNSKIATEAQTYTVKIECFR
ncbi:MAG: WG repeat-containing protein [Candidatus Aminicenantes bacterium]|nr:WG repeat-containing protein [Candidatus Aminicenantes bacterium]